MNRRARSTDLTKPFDHGLFLSVMLLQLGEDEPLESELIGFLAIPAAGLATAALIKQF